MASIKISELTALTPPAAADELAVVDVSASSTKKTTVGEVVGIINGDVEVASNGTATISDLPVSKLADGAARQLLQTDAAGTGVEWTSSIDLPGTLDVTSTATFDSIAQHPLGTAGAPTITFTGDTNTGIYSPGADQVAISTNGTGRLFINATGQVGIGGSPSSDFEITSALPIARLRDTTDNSYGEILNNNGALSIRADEGNVSSASYIDIRVDGSERARFTSDGRLGLGTSSPQLPFTIGAGGGANPATSGSTQSSGGIARIGSSGAATLDVGTLAAGPVWLQATNVTNLATNYSLLLNPNGGNVGIGTTSPGVNLDVATSGNVSIRAQTTDTSGANIGQLLASYTGGGGGTASTVALRAGDAYAILGTTTNTSLLFGTNNAERARVDSSGRLLVGTSSGVSAAFVNSSIQAHGITGDASSVTLYRFTTSATAAATPRLVMARSGSDSKDFTVVANGNRLGQFNFVGADGTQFISAASIDCEVDGTPGTNGMPGRLVLSVTLDGASSPTEALRITNDRVVAYNQPAPAAVNATATLTVANLKTGIITSTSAAATDMTLPTGTDTQAGFSGTYDNFTFEWSVINTGPSLVRVLAGTAHTIVGSGSVATGTSGRFASRRTAANTFVTYRLS